MAHSLPMRPGFAQLRRAPLVLFVAAYTVVTGGPLLWVAMMTRWLRRRDKLEF